jgi:hypothetical protein
MENIICIDLTMYNNEKLVSIANELNIKSETLLENKKLGFAKLYINEGKVLAFTTKKNKETIVYTPSLDEEISKIVPFTIEEPSVMTVDSILDKINKYGIETLTKTEIDFLEKNS